MKEVNTKIIPVPRQVYTKLTKILLISGIITVMVMWTILLRKSTGGSTQLYRPVVAKSSKQVEEAKNCFRLKVDSQEVLLLDDVMEAEKKPTPGKSIFFHETSCSTNGLISLNARQACAIESAAKLNPNRDVFVLFAAPVGFSLIGDNPDVINALQAYSNVYFRNLDLETYAANTAAQKWLETDKLFLSKFLNSHVSDFLRFLTLYKFGGTYLDLDIVVQKNFDFLPANLAGHESKNNIAVGILSLQHDDVGHSIAEQCIREFSDKFNGNDWGKNGPGVITRVLGKICNTAIVSEMKPENCDGFKVFEQSAFYAVPWREWEKFMKPETVDEVLNATQNSVFIHVWNKYSIQQKIKRIGPKTAYGIVAKKNCPRVYRVSGDYF